VPFTVTPNSGGSRSGKITIGGKNLDIRQRRL
jgi:hypothetical protein